VILGLTIVSAEAFQETAPAPEPAGPAAVAERPQSEDSPLGLAAEDQDSEGLSAAQSGIGGVSSLNFGLELLYGGRVPPEDSSVEVDDNVGVKGRLRHTF